jgi:hypothetical protein
MSGIINNITKNTNGMEVTKGTKVAEVQKQGSKAQQLAATIFDVDKDGKFNRKEASLFNNYNCSLNEETGELKLRHKGIDEVIEIKYNSSEDLNTIVLENDRFADYTNNNMDEYANLDIYSQEWSKLSYDKVNKELTVEKLKSMGDDTAVIAKELNKLNILDSDLQLIDAMGTKFVNIKNTKDETYNEPIELVVDRDAIVNIDEDTDIYTE